MKATRIMVYSHDAFGLGNLRRMLAICEHLLDSWSELSVLLVSGSPMIHEFRLPKGLDYIKLPCLNRGLSGELSAKYLGTSAQETVALRSQLIHSAAVHFKPHLLLVDKKPTGLQGELSATLNYMRKELADSKCVLLLRDILDAPKKTISEWRRYGYYQTIQSFYDRVLVVGMQAVFDLVQAYRLPLPVARKVYYCGYIRKPETLRKGGVNVRSQLGLHAADRLVLVTPGGGEDGYSLVHTYLSGLQQLERSGGWQMEGQQIEEQQNGLVYSLILSGPEMPSELSQQLQQVADSCSSRIVLQSFTREILPYLQSADTVVSMGGYNTLTEILALRKRAVVLPRTQPSKEQLIRASRFAKREWITTLNAQQATPAALMQAVLNELNHRGLAPNTVNFEGLARVADHLRALISPTRPVLGTTNSHAGDSRTTKLSSSTSSSLLSSPASPPLSSSQYAIA